MTRPRSLVVLTSLVALLAAMTALAGPLTPADIARIRQASGAVISPDGKHIAYLRTVPRDLKEDDNGSSWTELHVVDMRGIARPFITGKVKIRSIKWTPNGEGISFLAKRGDDEHTALYIIPVNGGEARKLIEHDTDISSYEFKPDGTEVAFLANEKPDEDVKKNEDKGFDAEIYEEDFHFTRVWITSAKHADEHEHEPRQLELDGDASAIHWSPTGGKLVLALAKTPRIDDYYMFRKLHVVDAGSGTVTATIDNVGKLGPVRWCPDGRHIAFLSGADLNDPSEGRLMVASAEGGSPHQVAPDYRPNFVDIAFQEPDTIMFLAEDGCYSAVGEVNLDGSGLKIIVPTGGPILGNFTLSRDGRHAGFIGHSPKHAREVFVMSHGDSAPRRLTNLNMWLDSVPLARQEVIRYPARDGETIEAVLIHPLDEQPGKRYPLILDVHGGPEASVPNGWVTRYSQPGQVAAAEGFAVLLPNYRGSTGRGVAFAKAHQSDYGGKEFDDCLDGIDYLIGQGLVDKARVGVTGGSYGGFATAWMCTRHTERFAAGVMFVGISNQISKSGTTDIPEEMYLVHARKRIWEDWQFFLERSPIYYVEKARTPLLIMHGKEDPRVHPAQSMELYRNLKILGKTPVRLVYYPGEGHGNRKAAARYDYNLRMMRWMQHYLEGPGGDPPPHKLDYGLDEEEDSESKDDGTPVASAGKALSPIGSSEEGAQ